MFREYGPGRTQRAWPCGAGGRKVTHGFPGPLPLQTPRAPATRDPHVPIATEADGRGGQEWGGLGLPLTVVPGQVLEGLIKQDDGQRDLQHHTPLAPTQWGHLENELWGRLVKGRLSRVPQATGSSPRLQGFSPRTSGTPPEAPPQIPVHPLSLLQVPSQPHPRTHPPGPVGQWEGFRTREEHSLSSCPSLGGPPPLLFPKSGGCRCGALSGGRWLVMD